MIKLVFTRMRDAFTIEIENKIIVWREDKKYPRGIQFLPKDKDFKKIVLMSRNKIPKEIIAWIEDANSGKNLEEYQGAKDDEALAQIVIKDAKVNGCVFQGVGK